MSFPGAPKWPSDSNPKPHKPFLPQSPIPPVATSVMGRFCLFRTVLFVFNVTFDIWLGAQRALCWLLCSDEWIFLPNFTQRCSVGNHRTTPRPLNQIRSYADKPKHSLVGPKWSWSKTVIFRHLGVFQRETKKKKKEIERETIWRIPHKSKLD